MPIRKNTDSGVWWIDIRTPGGQRVRRSAGTKSRKAAQEYHDKVKAELWRVAKLGEQPDRTYQEAAVRFLKLAEGQRDYGTKVRHVAYWLEHFKDMPVRSLTTDAIVEALPTHRIYDKRKAVVLTAATKNRHLSTIKRMLTLCQEWGWITVAPKLPRFEEPDVRIRWEPPVSISKILTALTRDWMRDISLVAVSTGMRANELLSLQWNQVDLKQANAWVHHAGAKSGQARSVPLNADVLDVLKRRQGLHDALVFSREARPGREASQISQVDADMFERACKAADVSDFHFHDLRHTWASWHVQAGTPLMVLKELGGWETIEMVQKYAHLAPSHLALHAETVTFWSQKQRPKEKPPMLAVVNN